MKIEIDVIDNAMFAEAAKCSREAQQLIYAARNPNNKAMAKSLQHKADKLVERAEGIQWARRLIYAERVKDV
jgi:hypothetical protein